METETKEGITLHFEKLHVIEPSRKFETDKLTAEYTLKIPQITKDSLDVLSSSEKKRLNHKIMKKMAKAIHDHRFIPMIYLKST